MVGLGWDGMWYGAVVWWSLVGVCMCISLVGLDFGRYGRVRKNKK